MSERIQKVLDGELQRSALSEAELRLLAEYEALLGAAAATIERHPAPDLSGPIMRRIEELDAAAEATSRTALDGAAGAVPHPDTTRAGAGRIARLLDWLWTPRPIAVRPAWGLAAALLVVMVLGSLDAMRGPEGAPVVADQPATEAQIFVHFRLDAPDASSVHLAGDFTGWEPEYELHESRPGVWTVVVPLEAGVHDYAFIVDGQRWTPDPLAPAVDDGFGGENSRLSLLPPERRRA